ncbi:hypothetical protein AAES_131481 [Amazona aestiva]|uniref:Uncharacterized protein n=1 Tax=Amazona aestiva TaxID=12930 RepID=A0A0Q3PL25_AMAAE|nr:hypothetical protein AAES_131481 [Amazona aestiva]
MGGRQRELLQVAAVKERNPRKRATARFGAALAETNKERELHCLLWFTVTLKNMDLFVFLLQTFVGSIYWHVVFL